MFARATGYVMETSSPVIHLLFNNTFMQPQKHTVDTPVQYPKKPTPVPTPTSSLTTRGKQQEASADGTAEVTPCGTNDTVTKWCCGHNNTACCFEDSV